MGDEWTLALDLLMENQEPIPISVDVEAGDRPQHLAQEMDDRPDIVEDRAQRLLSEIQ